MNLSTPRATKVLGALSLLVVTGLGWTFVVGPETTALSDVRMEIESTRDQNDVLALQLVTLQKQAKQLGETRRAARQLAARFPPTADQPGLFEMVTEAAVGAGIGPNGVTTLAPSPPVIGGADPSTGVQLDQDVTGAQLARQNVSVSIQGTYAQTQQLLENLEQMPRAFLLTTVTLGGGGDTGGYTTTVTGDMFVMPPVPAPDKTVKTVSLTGD